MRSTTALAVVLVLPACTAQPVSPATVAADTQRSVEARARAVASLASLEDPDSLALLRELAWSPRTPAPIGTAAISALADRSPGVTMADAAERLDDLDRWPVLEAAVAAASRCVANGSPSDATRVALAAAAARSLARPSARYHDAQRPELELLLAATEAATAESALLGLVDPDAATERHTTLGDRAAAWTAYHRRVGPERARVAAERFAGDALPAAALRRLARGLDQLPHNRTTLAWGLSAKLPAEPVRLGHGVALRHLPALHHGVVISRHSKHPGSTPAPPTAAAPRRLPGAALAALPSEDYRDAAPRLTPADRQHLAIVAATLAQPRVVAGLFAAADADHADTSSEHGGLLILSQDTPPRPTYRAYPPMLARGDDAYVPGPELILDLQERGLAHVHFHAQRHANADYAGPAGGDLDFVRRQAVAAVVLTFLDPDTLNADYVQPDPDDPNATPVVIDLGNLTRPR
ncbi:MAG: hypothetical protein AAGI54_05740 [Planctomycetota bacterium]